jgi:hypothetical protein
MMRAGIKERCHDRGRLLFLCKLSWIVIHICRRHPSVCAKVKRGGIAHRIDMVHRA